jgi:hypothetical protein
MARAKPRWITVRKPFDYHWPGRAAVTAYREADLGEHMVKAEVADFAVENGYATEGKLDGSEARSRKGTGAKRTSSRRRKPAAKAADTGRAEVVGDADAADADRTADRPPVDHDAG